MTRNHRKPHLHSYRDRVGKMRHYLRRPGDRSIPLKAVFGTPAFEAEYHAALATVIERPVRLRWPHRDQLLIEEGEVVYFVRAGQYVKIGYSGSAADRIKLIRTDTPYRVTILLTINGNKSDEIKLHEEFRHLRHRGEWFRAAPELLRFIIQKQAEKVDGKRIVNWLTTPNSAS